MPEMTGNTLSIQGVSHTPPLAKMFCISMQRCAASRIPSMGASWFIERLIRKAGTGSQAWGTETSVSALHTATVDLLAAIMNVNGDDLTAVVRYALETTRATATCPFHWDVIVRVGDDAAESHAFERARKMTRSDGTHWPVEALREELARQLGEAADGMSKVWRIVA